MLNLFNKQKPDLEINLDEFYGYLKRIAEALEKISKNLGERG